MISLIIKLFRDNNQYYNFQNTIKNKQNIVLNCMNKDKSNYGNNSKNKVININTLILIITFLLNNQLHQVIHMSIKAMIVWIILANKFWKICDRPWILVLIIVLSFNISFTPFQHFKVFINLRSEIDQTFFCLLSTIFYIISHILIKNKFNFIQKGLIQRRQSHSV